MSGRYRFALRAYPRTYRHDHGDELAETALLLGDGRWSFAQARSLVVGGLRTRCRLSTGGSTASAVAGGVSLGLLLFHLVAMVPAVASSAFVYGPSLLGPAPVAAAVVLSVAVALAFGANRASAVIVTVVNGAMIMQTVLGSRHLLRSLRLLDLVLVNGLTVSWVGSTVAVWWLVRRHPGVRPAPLAVSAVLIVLAAGFVALGFEGAWMAATVVVVVAYPLIGLLALPVDPRPAIAAATAYALYLLVVVPRLARGGSLDVTLVVTIALLVVWGAMMATVGIGSVRRLARHAG